jgi:hypothetical protein
MVIIVLFTVALAVYGPGPLVHRQLGNIIVKLPGVVLRGEINFSWRTAPAPAGLGGWLM